jgi:hypothetical protein
MKVSKDLSFVVAAMNLLLMISGNSMLPSTIAKHNNQDNNFLVLLLIINPVKNHFCVIFCIFCIDALKL